MNVKCRGESEMHLCNRSTVCLCESWKICFIIVLKKKFPGHFWWNPICTISAASWIYVTWMSAHNCRWRRRFHCSFMPDSLSLSLTLLTQHLWAEFLSASDKKNCLHQVHECRVSKRQRRWSWRKKWDPPFHSLLAHATSSSSKMCLFLTSKHVLELMILTLAIQISL